jgi:hypothetical protein
MATEEIPQGITVDEFESKKDENGAVVENLEGIVTRWFAELELADRAEKNWRNEAKGIYAKYRSEKEDADRQAAAGEDPSFNVLWSNTEILVPALYNSTPTPDVRRRFKDKDPIGKVTSTIMERALAASMDSYDFDDEVSSGVLDVVLSGRGVARLRYRPKTAEVADASAPAYGAAPDPQANSTEATQAAAGAPEQPVAPAAAPMKRIVDQKCEIEHVQWDKFRRGPGKRWRNVPWISFELDLSYDDLVEYFGEDVAKKVKLDQLGETDQEGLDKDSGVVRLFSSVKVFEIWDKLKRRVIFITKSVKEPLHIDNAPTLQLHDFFPMPRPAMAILDSTKLIPVPLYRQYKSQAHEIDKLTRRIDKTTDVLRMRGVYLSSVKAVRALFDAGDNDFVPLEDEGNAIAQVCIDKAIWTWPIDKVIQVLEGLYKAREQLKQTIFEIVGLSDIMRGASKATETLGAQELKSRWGSVRLQRMQKEIQRWVRDLLRLKAEIIGETYEPDVLQRMTQVQLPTIQQKEMLQRTMQEAEAAKQKLDMQAQEMQAQGQPPPPTPAAPEMPEGIDDVLDSPTWDDVMAVLRSDEMRQYRINIETDSTIVEILNRDFQGLSEILGALGNVFGAIPLLQQAGASNGAEVIKEIALSIVRQSRMGRAVEDSIENLDFKSGQMQMQQMGESLNQLGQAVQQGTQQISELAEKSEQRDQRLGQHEQLMKQMAQAMASMPAPPPASPAQPATLQVPGGNPPRAIGVG